MSYIIPMEKPKRCGLCPCFHAEHPMHCQAVKAHKDKRIIAPYGAPIPDWCPLIELPPHATVGNEYQRWWNGALESVIDNAPTVIEAEGSET